MELTLTDTHAKRGDIILHILTGSTWQVDSVRKKQIKTVCLHIGTLNNNVKNKINYIATLKGKLDLTRYRILEK